MTAKEKQVKEEIKRVLTECGAMYFMPVASQYGRGGVSDVIACAPMVITESDIGSTIGRFMALEAKSVTGTLSPLQDHFLTQVAAAYGAGIVITGTRSESQDIAQLEAVLRRWCP